MISIEALHNSDTRRIGNKWLVESATAPVEEMNVVPLVGITQAESRVFNAKEAPTPPADGLVCTGLYLISRDEDLPSQYDQLVKIASAKSISIEEQFLMLPDVFRTSRNELSLYHTTIKNGANYLPFLQTNFETADLVGHIIEADNLAEFPVDQVVTLMRILDEDIKVENTFVNIAASRLDQVLTTQEDKLPSEEREAHADSFYTQTARLLHTMPEILVYMKPEDRIKIFEKYDPVLALQRKSRLQVRYADKFNTDVKGEAYTSFKASWDQLKNIDQYLQAEVFSSDEDNEQFRQIQIDKLFDLSDKTATFKAQYTSIAVQTLLDAQTSIRVDSTRRLTKLAIQQIIHNIPIASPLVENPVVLLPNVKTTKVTFDLNTLSPAQKAALGLTPETRKTQDIEAVKITEKSTEEYFARPYLLLELKMEQRVRIINEMFAMIATPEGLAKVKEFIENAKNEPKENKPASRLEEINSEIVSPKNAGVFIMQILRQLRNVEEANLSKELPRIVNQEYDLDPTHATDFYWLVRELLETIITCQNLDQDENKKEVERLELVKRIELLTLDDQVKLLLKLKNIKTENVISEVPHILDEAMPNVVTTNSPFFFSTITEVLENLTSPNLLSQPQQQTAQLKTTSRAIVMGHRAQNLFKHLFTSTPEVKITETQIMPVVRNLGN